MNKKLIAIIVAVVLILGGAGAFVVMNNNSSSDDTGSVKDSSQDASDETSEKSSDASITNLPKQTVGQQPDCSLYSLEEIASIWGVPMTDTDIDGSKVMQINGPQNYQYECDYNETDSGLGLTVSIQYKVYENEDAAKSSISNTRSGAKFGDTVYFINDEVSNIGDEAFFSKSANGALNTKEEQLYARDGNVVYLMTAVNLDGIQSNAREKILETYRLKLK
jgi:uncharacterized protein (UPF0333 family)